MSEASRCQRGASRLLSLAPAEVQAEAQILQPLLERLQQRQPQLSSGFLNGVIDLIIRRPSCDGCQHWVVLDWKTNRLVRPINDLMAAKDYWLQAQLYRQAVQRWLQWRLGADTPLRIDAVMLFTRNGEGAWLLDGAEQR